MNFRSEGIYLLLVFIIVAGTFFSGNNLGERFFMYECPQVAETDTDIAAINITTDVQQQKSQPLPPPPHQSAHWIPAPSIDYGGSSWCPYSKCSNSPLCYPCKRRYLVIFASGRSASTTLTWMMDSLPGVRMSGENMDLLTKQFSFFQTTVNDHLVQNGMGRKSPFGRNKIPMGASSCILHSSIELLTPPKLPIDNMTAEDDMIVGFKTIRSHRNKSEKKMKEFAEFLKQHLPCARFFVNYRSDSAAHVQSVKNSFKAMGTVEKTVEVENQNLKDLHELLGPDRAYLLDSTEWTKDVKVLNKALDWLGYHPNCHFPSLLEFNTKNGFTHTKETYKNESAFGNCTGL